MDEQQGQNSQAEAIYPPSTPTQAVTPAADEPVSSPTKASSVLEKWLPILKQYEAEGGNQSDFCDAHGIPQSTFSLWWAQYRSLGESGLRKYHGGTVHHGSWKPDERRMAVEMYLKSGVGIADFARTWGVGYDSLKAWVENYQTGGPKALEKRVMGSGRPRRKGVRELIEKAKKENPTFGLKKVKDFLGRMAGVKVSTGGVRNALKGKGYPKGGRVRRHEKSQLPRRFERAAAGELWQSDITSFVLPRHGQRVYLTVFLDDYSRYIVSWGLGLQQKQELVIEALLSGIDRFGKPKEVLTDQGRQYFSWRGKGDFQRLLQREGIQHVVARTHHPQTVGKTERFWATVMEEFWDRVTPQELDEARGRLGHFINHYNHFRPHQGIGGLVPADRFFGAENQVRQALESTMAKNEVLLALEEAPRKPVYLVGQIGDQQVSMHGEKGRMVIQTPDGRVQEMDFGNLGMGSKGVDDGRDTESKRKTGIPWSREAEVQDTDQGGSSSEGPVGNSYSPGTGKGAPDGGDDVGILDGTSEERRSGGEVGCAPLEGLADVATGIVGDGGGVGETTEEREKGSAIDVTARGGSEGIEQENPGVGERSGFDERAGEVAAGTPGEPGSDEKG